MHSSKSDHYATLGLSRTCTLAQIRAAYRMLSKHHHPDVNPGSDEADARFREINEAHETLSDPDRRRAYDRELNAASAPAKPARSGKIERNISQDAQIRIEDFLRGTSLDVRVNDPANPNGQETYQLIVPPDTAPGTRFRLPRADPFAGGFIIVRLRALPGFRFKARGSDLRGDLRIQTRRVTQGGSEMITGPTGAPICVQIPAGVSRGEILRIAGQGLPKPRGGRGDLLLRITYRPEVRISRSQGG